VGMKVSSIIGLIQWSLVKLVLVMGGIFLVSILGLFQMIRKISLPLNELTEYAENLSQHHFESPSTYYDAITQLSQTSTDEIGKLSQAFVRLEKDLISYIENLKTTTSEKEKIESELAIARDIQMSFLPKAVNQSGPNYELDIVPFIQPAKEVGGDFYDIIMKPSDNRLFMAMGDVSGKGTPAALFMAKTATLLRATIAHNQSPSEILSIVNQELCHGNDNCLFVTVFLGELNLTTGELTYCLAGHPPAYIVNQSTVTALPLVQGMALGIESHVFFQSNVVTLSPEDRLFLYTDGMTDMTNDDQEMYTESGLELFLKRTSNEGMKETQGLLESEIDQFTGQAPQYDDITTMMVQWSSKAVTVSEKLSVFFENELSELVKLQQVIQLYGQSNQLSDTLQNSINLVLEELLTNIISYGYEDHDSHKIYLHLSLKEGVLTAVIEDDGIPFNPLEAPDVDVSQSIEDISVGGLGIHFVRTLMDDLYYERKQNKNNLTMTKRLVASDLKEEQS